MFNFINDIDMVIVDSCWMSVFNFDEGIEIEKELLYFSV